MLLLLANARSSWTEETGILVVKAAVSVWHKSQWLTSGLLYQPEIGLTSSDLWRPLLPHNEYLRQWQPASIS